MKRVAVFGGSLNPAARHHRAIAETVAPRFDLCAVVPCGPRPDKAPTNDIEPIHRAVMADMTFRGIPGAEVDLFDLEHATFTRTIDLDALMAAKHGAEIWHVVGTDLFKGGKDGASSIQSKWHRGAELWQRLNFAVVPRQGYPVDEADLPPNRIVLPECLSGASSDIRPLVFQRQPYRKFVTGDVADYIERYNLYRGGPPARATALRIADPKALLVFDERNPRAKALADRFGDYAVADASAANCVIAVGGDGTMLRAIRKHWRSRLPFVGVNAGHKGWLLNDAADLEDPSFLFDNLRAQLMPQLYVEFTREDGAVEGHYAFNDAWLERSTGQCAWLEVDAARRIPKLVCDGALVCTAAGSTAYARAMGATPLIDEAESCLLVGSNVMEPKGWKVAPFSFHSTVALRTLDPDKRPVRGYVDGVDVGIVRGMTARVSRIASVELCFSPTRDRAAKLAEELFPA